MRRNRLVLIFILILFGPYWILVQSLKSEFAVNLILKELKDKVSILSEYNLSFNSIEISFLKLQTKFIDVEISKGDLFEFQGGDVTFDFSFGNLVKKDLAIHKVIEMN